MASMAWMAISLGSMQLSVRAPDHLVCRKQSQNGYDSDMMSYLFVTHADIIMHPPWFFRWILRHVIYTDLFNAQSGEQNPANLGYAEGYTNTIIILSDSQVISVSPLTRRYPPASLMECNKGWNTAILAGGGKLYIETASTVYIWYGGCESDVSVCFDKLCADILQCRVLIWFMKASRIHFQTRPWTLSLRHLVKASSHLDNLEYTLTKTLTYTHSGAFSSELLSPPPCIKALCFHL